MRVSPNRGIQAATGKGSVPDMVAPRAGFQGLKISQMMRAMAMKFIPSPAKISCTWA